MGDYTDRAKAERRIKRKKKKSKVLDYRFGISDLKLKKKKKPCKKKVKK